MRDRLSVQISGLSRPGFAGLCSCLPTTSGLSSRGPHSSPLTHSRSPISPLSTFIQSFTRSCRCSLARSLTRSHSKAVLSTSCASGPVLGAGGHCRCQGRLGPTVQLAAAELPQCHLPFPAMCSHLFAAYSFRPSPPHAWPCRRGGGGVGLHGTWSRVCSQLGRLGAGSVHLTEQAQQACLSYVILCLWLWVSHHRLGGPCRVDSVSPCSIHSRSRGAFGLCTLPAAPSSQGPGWKGQGAQSCVQRQGSCGAALQLQKRQAVFLSGGPASRWASCT